MNEGTSLLFTLGGPMTASFNPDKHQHNYLISARLILNRVPY